MFTPFSNKFEWVRALSDPNSGLTSTQHHVALALAEWLSQHGTGYVTHRQLAMMTRMSERTICDALTELTDMMWLERTPGKVGRATSYRIAKKPGWKPTPKEELATRKRRKRRKPVDKDTHEIARRLLTAIYAATGVDSWRVDDDTETARRLLGAMRRQCSSAVGEGSFMKLYAVMSESPLTSAHDPAAVLLARYKKALRTYPHLKPVREREVDVELRSTFDKLLDSLRMPKDDFVELDWTDQSEIEREWLDADPESSCF